MTRLAAAPTSVSASAEQIPLVIAIDGGNSKTEVLLVRRDGRVLARARGGGFRPQSDGIDAAMEVLSTIIESLPYDRTEPAELVSAYLAGADLPEEEVVLSERLAATGWGRRVTVGNDTLALLRCGSPERWGVAVVCGAGINAMGVGPDGALARFPALGELTGDWGGGYGLARTALWSAVRGEDGRGPATALSDAIAEHFGCATALDVGLSVHLARMTWRQVGTITPLLFEVAATGDEVATGIVEQLAAEVAGMAAVLIRRLGLADVEVPLVLGGGVLAAGHRQLDEALTRQIAARSLRVSRRVPTQPPVYGAALLAMDDLGANDAAEQTLLRTVATWSPPSG
jgi:N-acetylglucosamine kinase-like BadF-type ATPase